MIINDVQDALEEVPGEHGERIREKMETVLKKNPGFDAVQDIAIVLNGGQMNTGLAPNVIAKFKHAPIQSCEVERSFSVYKKILADDRTNFTPENLEMYMICNCNE